MYIYIYTYTVSISTNNSGVNLGKPNSVHQLRIKQYKV